MKFLINLLLFNSMTVGALPAFADQTPRFLEIARDEHGKVKHMIEYDADAYCKCDSEDARSRLGCTTPPNSAHLPSARELAQLSTSFGSKGIVDSCGSDRRCYEIDATNADGTRDSFYFSYAGYRLPPSDSVNADWFWTSNTYAIFPYPYSFGLYGFGGGALEYGDGGWGAVRCVAGQ